MTNKTLRNERVSKKEEFYTQYTDVEKELVHYAEQLRDKTVYCYCDNPSESNFVRYFTDNFITLGLNKLIATHYVDPQTTYANCHYIGFELYKEYYKTVCERIHTFKAETNKFQGV